MNLLAILLIGVAFAHAACVADPATTQSESSEQRTPVLVELFTSEGCSSCPPADKLLAELGTKQPIHGALIVPMALHVDYWNNLGWTDPFASAAFTDRQRAYASALRVRSIYTPQMIVDGQREFVGSDAQAARRAIADAAAQPKAKIEILVENWRDDRVELTIRLDRLPAGSNGAELMLAITEDDLHSSVARGENAGRKLAHTGAVRELRSLGTIDQDANAKKTSVELRREWEREELRVIVFAQDRGSRRVVAIGSVEMLQR